MAARCRVGHHGDGGWRRRFAFVSAIPNCLVPTRFGPFSGAGVIHDTGASCPPYRSMIIVCTAESAEKALADGRMRCPRRGCDSALARWGYGRRRRVRGLGSDGIEVRPRRVRCRGCGATQVLLPAALQPRRADSTEVIGTALARKAAGLGHRQIAVVLGRSPSTVRRWPRAARDPDHLTRLWQRGAQELIRLDADSFNQLASTGNLLRDTLTVLAAAAWWARRRLGIAEPVWTLIGLYTRGGLLARPG